MAAVLLLLVSSLYAVPGDLPAPDDAQAKRIEQALAELRGDDRERGVRRLALVGRPALRAVVARLNEAPPAERVLLLTAVSRQPEYATLLEQARRDPDPAVRALADPPAVRRRSLRQLAARYVDLLALTRNAKREEITKPLYELEPRIARPKDQVEAMRGYLGDEEMDAAVQGEYEAAAWLFARAGAAALQDGSLRPDPSDPVFIAYLGLVYDEDVAASRALEGIVGAGPKVAPAIAALLPRPEHDPRILGRILVAVGSGAELYRPEAGNHPELRFARIEMAARAHERAPAIAFLQGALDDEEGRNRKAALHELVELEARVTEFPRSDRYGDDEWALALELLAFAGDFEGMLAAVEGTPEMRRAFERVLHALPAERRAPLVERLLKHEELRLRLRALDLIEDAPTVLAVAKEQPDVREHAVLRAIRMGDASGLDLLEKPPPAVMRALRDGGFADELVAFALGEDEERASAALRQIRHLPKLDPKHEPALLALHAGADPPRRLAALEALVPLGTDAARQRILESGEDALVALSVFVDDGRTLPFSIPLVPFLEGAGAQRLQKLGRLGTAMPDLEPGFYLKLLEAWDAASIETEPIDGGAARQKVDAVRMLVRAPDPQSATTLLAQVLSGKLRDESTVVAVMQAAARQADGKALAALVPLLEAEIATYVPGDNGLPPDPSPKRDYLVWYGMRALACRQLDAALPLLCRTLLDPRLQRERYDEEAGRDLPIDWSVHAVEALRHYDAEKVGAAMKAEIDRRDADGSLAEIAPTHLFRIVTAWRSNAWRGRRLPAFALAICDLIDRYPYEGETGIARMLALGAQQRYGEAAAAGRAAADRVSDAGYRPADGSWSPARIRGRAAIYEALAKGKIPELVPSLDEPYLQWIAGVYLRFLVGDDAAALGATETAWRGTAWLNRDMRNLRADLMVRAGDPRAAWELMHPPFRAPVELRQDEGWYRYYMARAAAAAGNQSRARGELSEALRINRRLVASAKADPLLSDFGEVFRTADEDYFDLLFQD